MFHFVFLFRQIKPLQTYVSKKLTLTAVFKHVRLQNTLKGYEIRQIPPPRVDYA